VSESIRHEIPQQKARQRVKRQLGTRNDFLTLSNKQNTNRDLPRMTVWLMQRQQDVCRLTLLLHPPNVGGGSYVVHLHMRQVIRRQAIRQCW